MVCRKTLVQLLPELFNKNRIIFSKSSLCLSLVEGYKDIVLFHNFLEKASISILLSFSRLDIDVSEALCGMKRSLKTLDGRNIALVSKPGEIIKQADIKMIQGEGMPTFRVGTSFISGYHHV